MTGMDSNLGLYQWMTTVAKRVKGPAVFLAGVAFVGWGTGRLIEAGGKGIHRIVKGRRDRTATELPVFTVTAESSSGDLTLHVGDRFRAMERDGDAVLIEVLGNSNNPYFVSAALLETISDFPAGSDPTDDEPSPS